MSKFNFHTEESAPEASKGLIAGAKKVFGFLPNLMAGMSEAPPLLESYITLSGIFDKSNLSETEKQIILMTNNRLNNCSYCMAAHTTISQGKVPQDILDALRDGSVINDTKLEALKNFTEKVHEKRGWVSEADLADFLAVGYTKETVLEVVLGTSLKVLSNYTNHLIETPLDNVFESNAWTLKK